MRKSLLFILVLSIFICAKSYAAVTPSEVTEPECMINNGYSETFAETVMLSKSRTAGQPTEPLYRNSHNAFVRFCRNVFGYIDPSQDTDERMHHDVHPSPHWKDL